MWKLFQLLGVVMYISYPHALLSPSQMTLFGQYSELITKNDILYLHPDAARMSQIHDQVLPDLRRVWQLILNVTPLPLQGQTILHPPVPPLVQLFLINFTRAVWKLQIEKTQLVEMLRCIVLLLADDSFVPLAADWGATDLGSASRGL